MDGRQPRRKLDAAGYVDDTWRRVLRQIRDKNIWTIYAAILVLGVAYGISIALIAHHLDIRGMSKLEMGSLASWFAFGIVALSLPVGALIRRWSGKTTLALSLAGYALTVSLFPRLDSFTALVVDRFLDGACSVGIWVSCETILLMRAPRGMKATVTTLYAVAVAVGYVVGPLSAKAIVAALSIPAAFLISGALAVVAVVLVLVFLDPDDPAVAASHEAGEGEAAAPGGKLSRVLWQTKTSCFATFAYGYFQASVVLFLPLYLMESKAIAREDTIIIPFFFALGMLLFSNVAGRLGDRYGHLLLMRVLGTIGTAMVLGFILLSWYPLMAIAVFIAGASLASISPVSLALLGVVSEPSDYSRSNSIYNAFYAAGMLLGPKVSSLLFAKWGGAAMLLHLAALWVSFVVFTIVFAEDDPAARSPLVRMSSAPRAVR